MHESIPVFAGSVERGHEAALPDHGIAQGITIEDHTVDIGQGRGASGQGTGDHRTVSAGQADHIGQIHLVRSLDVLPESHGFHGAQPEQVVMESDGLGHAVHLSQVLGQDEDPHILSAGVPVDHLAVDGGLIERGALGHDVHQVADPGIHPAGERGIVVRLQDSLRGQSIITGQAQLGVVLGDQVDHSSGIAQRGQGVGDVVQGADQVDGDRSADVLPVLGQLVGPVEDGSGVVAHKFFRAPESSLQGAQEFGPDILVDRLAVELGLQGIVLVDLVHVHSHAVAGGGVLAGIVGHRILEALIVLDVGIGKADLADSVAPFLLVHVEGGEFLLVGTDSEDGPGPHLGEGIHDRIRSALDGRGGHADEFTDIGRIQDCSAGGLLHYILEDGAGLLDDHVVYIGIGH